MAGGRVLKICVLCAVLSSALAQEIRVNTTEGVVEGVRAPDGNYFAFYDIPYAGPTSGENRFKAPTPPPVRTQVFQAINRNTICAQPTSRGLVGTEDCLTLSVFTQNFTTPKPVLVWLNAEEYTNTPTSTMSYRRLVEEGLVFVTINFRVSVFGFLCLGVPDAPGNAGLRDIIQGLKWVQANIANFGGQPGNVMLIGHGSGAALVDLITMSPQAENLVHKAITLSGSALAHTAVAYDPVGYAELFGASLSYTDNSREKLAKLIQTTRTDLLVGALNSFKFTNSTPLFAPCIENVNLNPNDTILADAPINLLRSGKYLQIPYISAYTTREGTLRAPQAVQDKWLEEMQANFTNFLPVDIRPGSNLTTVASSIRRFYFSESPIDMATIEDYLEYHGDTLVLVPIVRAARERGNTSSQSVRLLEFAHRGTFNSDWPFHQIPLSGARHGAFLNYLFDFDLRPGDDTARVALVRRISRFAYTGDPNSPDAPQWNAITSETVHYNYIEGNSLLNVSVVYTEGSKMNPHAIRMNFWNDTYTRYYVPPPAFSSSNVVSFSIVLLFCTFISML
ncbi:venom carboxylesterase-6 [Manduca sexta]|uniref:Esterase n=1 Tax=Manduca sexta TaxID=7130 RepID=A0A977XKY5_MANSE|nr:venom carboxylesterase-6 [Manduca sexta]UXP71975.1 esterase [Manduca sexta]